MRFHLYLPLFAGLACGCDANDARFDSARAPGCNADSAASWSTGDVSQNGAGVLWANGDDARVELKLASRGYSLRESAAIAVADPRCTLTVTYLDKAQCDGMLCSFAEDYKEWIATDGTVRIEYDAGDDASTLDLDLAMAPGGEAALTKNIASGGFTLQGWFELPDLDF